MKILYGIQGTGHGHLSRARELLPVLEKKVDLDVLISGYENYMPFIEEFSVVYKKRGISLKYDSKGGVSLYDTFRQLNLKQFLLDVNTITIDDYDLVISDYEPVSAWAAWKAGVPCVGASHQASFESPNTPRPPKKSLLPEILLRQFAPCSRPVGFHFKRYDSFIHPPLIRKRIQEQEPGAEVGNHISVYLPAHHPEVLVPLFQSIGNTPFHLFSGQVQREYWDGNVRLHPIDNTAFVDSLTQSLGVITGGGFETCAEALYLGKKLMVVPIAYQYEQMCNAAALKEMGVPSTSYIDGSFTKTLRQWLKEDPPEKIEEAADVELVVDTILESVSQD